MQILGEGGSKAALEEDFAVQILGEGGGKVALEQHLRCKFRGKVGARRLLKSICSASLGGRYQRL